MKEDDIIGIGVISFLVLFGIFICLSTNNSLKTGYKGGMHSANDGCIPKHIVNCPCGYK